MRLIKTKCSMGDLCKYPHRGGDCDRWCTYNTKKVKSNLDLIREMDSKEFGETFFWLLSFIKNYTDSREALFEFLDAEEGSYMWMPSVRNIKVVDVKWIK